MKKKNKNKNVKIFSLNIEKYSAKNWKLFQKFKKFSRRKRQKWRIFNHTRYPHCTRKKNC